MTPHRPLIHGVIHEADGHTHIVVFTLLYHTLARHVINASAARSEITWDDASDLYHKMNTAINTFAPEGKV